MAYKEEVLVINIIKQNYEYVNNSLLFHAHSIEKYFLDPIRDYF